MVSSSWAATPRDELLRLVPDSVGFCLVLQDLRGHAAAWQTSPFFQQLGQSPFAAAVRNNDKWKNLSRIESKMKEKIGLDWARLRDDILGDAVVLAYQPAPPDQPQQEQGVMLLRARKEKILAGLIERLNRIQKEEGELLDLAQRRHNGITYYRRLEFDKRRQRNKPPSFYYIHGPILALSEQESMIRQIIDSDTRSPAPPLSPPKEEGDKGGAARHLNELADERALLAVWINPRAFDAHLDAKVAKLPPERAAAVGHFARYWKALDSMVLSLSLRKRDVFLSLGVRGRIADLPPAAQRLFDTAATTSAVWQRLPESALLAAGGRLDGAALLDVLGGFLTREHRQALHAALNRRLGALLGVDDFAKEVLPGLGPDWGFCATAPPAHDKDWMPQTLFALRVDAGRTRKYLHRDLFELLAGAFGVQPAHGLLHGYLVLASSLESLNRFAQAAPVPLPAADAPVLLMRISFAAWRAYLTENRGPIVQFLAEHHKLSREAAGKQVDILLAGLQFVERAELSQRSAPSQVIFTLKVRTAQALKK